MIVCVIGADWGEQGVRGGKKTVKEDNLLMLKKIWVWRRGGAIRNKRLYYPICSVRSSNKKKGFARSNLALNGVSLNKGNLNKKTWMLQ